MADDNNRLHNLPEDLPANLPEDFSYGQIIAPNGADVGMQVQYGYNYLMKMVNDAQKAVNVIKMYSQALTASQVGLNNPNFPDLTNIEQALDAQQLALANKANIEDLDEGRIVKPEWFDMPLLNGTTFSNTNAHLQYCKVGATVCIRGGVIFSQVPSYVFAKLPVGFRGYTQTISVPSATGLAPAYITIYDNGDIFHNGSLPNMTLSPGTVHHISTSFIATH